MQAYKFRYRDHVQCLFLLLFVVFIQLIPSGGSGAKVIGTC